MDITFLGHSCFRIRGSQAVIITDPFPPDIGYTLGKQTADIVTVSHPHPSHSFDEGVAEGYRLVKSPGEYEISGVLILGISTYHDAVKGESKGKNTAYLMEVDGITICHLGDIGHVLSDDHIEEMGNVDVLLVPVGGVSSLNASMAAETVRKVDPKVVIPMHYKTDNTKRDLEPVENFLKEMGQTHVEPRPKFTASRTNLPLTLQVVVLTV